MTEKVKLSKKNVHADMLKGLSRKELAEKYNLPMSQMKAAIEALGLTGVRAKKIMFEIVPDEEEIIPDNEQLDYIDAIEEYVPEAEYLLPSN